MNAPATTPRRRRWPRVAAAAAVLVAAAVVGFVWWASSTPEVGSRVDAALRSDGRVEVSEDDGYTFRPVDGADVGLVLYPGARVAPASYAVSARAIAEEGFLVVVPELTLNLAVLDPSAADDVIADHTEVDRWVVGGHSLGGAMAAGYVEGRPERVVGLLLWAAYPAGSVDLSSADLLVASISGSLDGLTTPADVADSRSRLPDDTDFVVIEGGNHAQFGDYGAQAGDNHATIGVDEQQAQIVEASVRLLRSV